MWQQQNENVMIAHISSLLLPNLLCLLFDYPFVLAVLEILANLTDRISKKTLKCYTCCTIRPKLHKKLVKLLNRNFKSIQSIITQKTQKSNEAVPSKIPHFGKTLTSSDNAIPECIATSSVKRVYSREMIIHIF